MAPSDAAQLVIEGLEHSARTLALGNPTGGLLVAAALSIHLAARLRSGRSAATTVAWNVGALAWWVALVVSRGSLASPGEARYRLVGAVFLLLGALPDAGARAPAMHLGVLGRRPKARWVPAAGAAAVISAVSLLSHHAFDDARRTEAAFASINRQQTVVVSAQPSTLEAAVELPIWMGYVTVDDLRTIQQRWNLLGTSSPIVADRELAAHLLPPTWRATPETCGEAQPTAQRLDADSQVTVRNPVDNDRTAVVSIRRFGAHPVRAVEVAPGQDASLTLFGSLADTPWVLQVEGGCIIE